MELITRFKHPVALQIRKTLEFEQDYVSALSQLSWTYMIAPSYLIVGGKDGDGAIITRQISLFGKLFLCTDISVDSHSYVKSF